MRFWSVAAVAEVSTDDLLLRPASIDREPVGGRRIRCGGLFHLSKRPDTRANSGTRPRPLLSFNLLFAVNCASVTRRLVESGAERQLLRYGALAVPKSPGCLRTDAEPPLFSEETVPEKTAWPAGSKCIRLRDRPPITASMIADQQASSFGSEKWMSAMTSLRFQPGFAHRDPLSEGLLEPAGMRRSLRHHRPIVASPTRQPGRNVRSPGPVVAGDRVSLGELPASPRRHTRFTWRPRASCLSADFAAPVASAARR